MPTPLQHHFQKRIDDAVGMIITRQIEPWFFLETKLEVKRFNGRLIAYSGIKFEGSPTQVFWGNYIEPFLEDLVVREIREAAVEAKARQVDGRLLLAEVQAMLNSAFRKVFRRMAEVDQRLRGEGYPENVLLRPVNCEQRRMEEFNAKHTAAELEMWRHQPKFETWFSRNKA